MKVGDLVHMPGSIGDTKGIVLETNPDIKTGIPKSFNRVKVYWLEGAESSWEPVKWLEVINPS
tara:strand:+ start:1131 stop:1319 length:189 start_codon:yes stop_codon:yes gene_type:complete